MTIQEKKDFLKWYRENELEAERLREELALWKSRAQHTAVSVAGEAVSSGGGGGFAACVEHMEGLRDKLAGCTAQHMQLHSMLTAAICELPTARLRLLMSLRYLDGKAWGEVSNEMEYEVRQLHNIHRQAIHEMQIMPYKPFAFCAAETQNKKPAVIEKTRRYAEV